MSKQNNRKVFMTSYVKYNKVFRSYCFNKKFTVDNYDDLTKLYNRNFLSNYIFGLKNKKKKNKKF